MGRKMDEENKTLYQWLNSPLSLLIAGFLLTTIVGSYINNAYHNESWRSKARFEIFRERLKEASEAQSSIIVMSNKRIVLLERIVSELGSGRLQSARDIWKEYYKVVKQWNNNVKSNNNRLSLLFGDGVSLSFLDNQEIPLEQPKSLHYIFRKAHDAVLAVIECMKINCGSSEQVRLMQIARERLDTLGLAHDEFATNLRVVLKQKEIELLK